MFSQFLTRQNILFLIMGIIVLFFVANIVDIALMLFAAFVISCTLIPLIDKMEKYIPRALAVSIMLVLIMFGILLVLIPLTIFTLEQGYEVFKNLPQYISQIQILLSFKILGFSPASLLTPEALSSYGESISSNLLSFTIDFTKSLAGSAMGAFAIAIMVFFICHDAKHMQEVFLKLFPEQFKEKADEILGAIVSKVGGYVFAQILSMVFVGLLTAIGLALIGNKNALSLGFVTGVLDIIPVIGPVIAIALGLFSVAAKGFGYLVLTFVIFLLAQVLQNQLLRPILFGKFMDIHPMVIIISLLVGAKFLGVWGVILAPAIASIVCILIDELYIKTINKEG